MISWLSIPHDGSMYAIYGNIYHQYTPVMLAYTPAPWILHGYHPTWSWHILRVCLKIGYIPNEIAIFHRDNDQQNQTGFRGTNHFQTHPYGGFPKFPQVMVPRKRIHLTLHLRTAAPRRARGWAVSPGALEFAAGQNDVEEKMEVTSQKTIETSAVFFGCYMYKHIYIYIYIIMYNKTYVYAVKIWWVEAYIGMINDLHQHFAGIAVWWLSPVILW